VTQICKALNVNEQWLLTGDGEMFNEINLNEVQEKFELTNLERTLVEKYLNLDDDKREAIITTVHKMLDRYHNYRLNLNNTSISQSTVGDVLCNKK
jgi:hypothetical protein